MTKTSVSIIIANYNGEKFLETCLRSVLKSSYKAFELIIVDDGSTDESLEVIKRFSKKDLRIKILQNQINMGAAASRNKAIKEAKGKILIFLDNDTEVTKNWIEGLLNVFRKNKKVGACQSLILDFHKRKLIQNPGGKLIPATGWLDVENQWLNYTTVCKKIDGQLIIPISAALAVKSEVFKKVRGFDEKEGVYTEDIDLGWRIWIAGYQIVLASDSIIFHWTKGLKNRSSMGATYRKIYFNLAKNSFRSIIKNYEVQNILIYLPISFLIKIGRGAYFVLRKNDGAALIGTIQAIVWTIANLSNTLMERQHVQSVRLVKDKMLFNTIFLNRDLFSIYKKNL